MFQNGLSITQCQDATLVNCVQDSLDIRHD